MGRPAKLSLSNVPALSAPFLTRIRLHSGLTNAQALEAARQKHKLPYDKFTYDKERGIASFFKAQPKQAAEEK